MTTRKLRAALKAIDEEITVSPVRGESGLWMVRTSYNLDRARDALDELGLIEIDKDVEGSQWDWRHVLWVEEA